MQPHNPLYLSTGAAARRLHLARATLWRAPLRGAIIPAFHTPGGKLRFRVADIDAYGAHLATRAQETRQGGHAPRALEDSAYALGA